MFMLPVATGARGSNSNSFLVFVITAGLWTSVSTSQGLSVSRSTFMVSTVVLELCVLGGKAFYNLPTKLLSLCLISFTFRSISLVV